VLACAPPNANVLLFTPMGVIDHYPVGELVEQFCQRLGYHVLRQGGRGSLSPRALLRRVVPLRWRDRLRKRLSPEAQRQLTASKYVHITDWERTTAFSIPAQFDAYLRVNLRGREPAGSVEPGAEYERLLAQLTADLNQLLDPRTGAPAVAEVVCPALLNGGGPPPALPDLVARFKPAPHFLDRLVHPRAEIRQSVSEFHRNSSHGSPGFYAAAGPAVRVRGEAAAVGLLDLAPTFLRLLGLPVPPAMPGRPAEALCGG